MTPQEKPTADANALALGVGCSSPAGVVGVADLMADALNPKWTLASHLSHLAEGRPKRRQSRQPDPVAASVCFLKGTLHRQDPYHASGWDWTAFGASRS